MRWISFPCPDVFECCGLPWLRDNLPLLSRLPERLAASLSKGVQTQAAFPAGGRLRIRCNSSELSLRVDSPQAPPAAGLDLYVDDRFWRTVSLGGSGERQVVCFTELDPGEREITIYLPLRQQLQIGAIGVDDETRFGPVSAFAESRPFILYGSSVAQGVGASRAGMSYAAALGRSLCLDHVNLGFGGAGRAEPDVVALVAQVDACLYLLDLGKSYGYQSEDVYSDMLAALREARPLAPIVCVTPIFSSREFGDPDYENLSRHTRAVVEEAVGMAGKGDGRLFLIEGERLLGREETDGLVGDGVHPNDLGHARIARRLRPLLEEALQSVNG